MTGLAKPSQWANQIEIRSETSSRIYVVAQKMDNGRPTGTWGCSCPGWKAYRTCKHLKSMGLRSCADRIQPAAKGAGTGDNRSFTDAAYQHYDVRTAGYGSSGEWFRLAEEMARGRRQYTPPPRRQMPGLAADMRLLGLAEMPADARDLARAMRRQARLVHPDFTTTEHSTQAERDAANEAFTAMQMAYERLLRRYPK
jgi:hypothetical protein